MRSRIGLRRNMQSFYQMGPFANGTMNPYPQPMYQPNMSANPYFSGQGLPYASNLQNQQQSFNGHYDHQYQHLFAYANPSHTQHLSPNQLLQNPLQPPQQHPNQLLQNHPNQVQYVNPYPKHSLFQKPKAGGSLLNSFKSQDGSIDLNKMVNTAGQMMHAVNQVSSMVKGLGSMFKV